MAPSTSTHSVAVPCSIVESEKDNRPDNFSLGEKADWDPSKYFVEDYETVLINTNDDVILLEQMIQLRVFIRQLEMLQ